MDVKLLALAATPPALAILAEVFNPVSERLLAPQIEEVARGLAPKPVGESADAGQGPFTVGPDDADRVYDARVASITAASLRMTTAAVEVAAVIPTWISVTAGIAAICVERADPVTVAIGTAVWAAACAVLGSFGFATVRFYDLGFLTSARPRRGGRKLTRQELLSRWLIIVNLIVIVVALVAAGLPEGAPAPLSPKP